MALPQFRSVGASASGTVAITPPLPAGILADDIMLLFIESQTAPNEGDPVGWTDVLNSPSQIDATTDTILEVKWRRVENPALEIAPTIADRGDHAIAFIAAYSGVIDTGDPWDVSAVLQLPDAARTDVELGPTLTTTVADCLVLDIRADSRDASGERWANHANASLSNLTQRFDGGTAQGVGGGLCLTDGGKALAGAVSATEALYFSGAAESKSIMALALQPPASGDALATPATVPTIMALPVASPVADSIQQPGVTPVALAIPQAVALASGDAIVSPAALALSVALPRPVREQRTRLLERTPYNPDPAVTRTAMGAATDDFDAANLRIQYTAPESGIVKLVLEGYSWSGGVAADNRQTFWNVREGGVDLFPAQRMHNTVNRTRHRLTRIITGLEPGSVHEYTWAGRTDSASVVTNLQAGLTDPAVMEVWEIASADLLDHVEFETDSTYTNTDIGVIADIDAANLAMGFTIPPSGKVMIEMEALIDERQQWMIREGSTVVAPSPVAADRQAVSESSPVRVNIRMLFEGLTPGQVKTWKWAWEAIEAADASMFAGAGFGSIAMRAFDGAMSGGLLDYVYSYTVPDGSHVINELANTMELFGINWWPDDEHDGNGVRSLNVLTEVVFVVPDSGEVYALFQSDVHTGNTNQIAYWGLLENGVLVPGSRVRMTEGGINRKRHYTYGVHITGLTPGEIKTWRWAIESNVAGGVSAGALHNSTEVAPHIMELSDPQGIGAAAVTVATPATIAMATAIPAVTLGLDASVTPEQLALALGLPMPLVAAGADVAASLLAMNMAVPAPTILDAGTVATPAAIALGIEMPQTLLSLGADVIPQTIARSIGLPTPTPITGADVAASLLAMNMQWGAVSTLADGAAAPAPFVMPIGLSSPQARASTSRIPALMALQMLLPTPVGVLDEDAQVVPMPVSSRFGIVRPFIVVPVLPISRRGCVVPLPTRRGMEIGGGGP